tara:strand:+ start:807 stop:1097 length:291 start_codon:yes stop_codon:yes gene_type:complete
MIDRLIKYLSMIKMNWKPLLLLLIVLLICYQFLFIDSDWAVIHHLDEKITLNSCEYLKIEHHPIRFKLITLPLLLFKENALIAVPFFLTALFMWKK